MRVTDRLKRLAVVFLCSISANASIQPVGQNTLALSGAPAMVGPAVSANVGKSCVSSDPDFLCLSLKYVVYKDPNSQQPVVSRKTVESNLNTINSIWRQCKIGFQVDEFLAALPTADGLSADTADFSDLDRIREKFDEPSSLLVVTTYKWRRDGNLGHTPANAWTKMPGSGIYGVIMEQKVGNFPNIIAHELGHYLNLYHVNERSEVMNAIIYNNSNAITEAQCSTARAAVTQYWKNMVRREPASSEQSEVAQKPALKNSVSQAASTQSQFSRKSVSTAGNG